MPAKAGDVACGACGVALADARSDDSYEARFPCPACGSLSRLVKVYLDEEIHIHDDLSMVKRSPGFRSGGRPRPAQEQWAGDVLSADGVWRRRERVVDREHNLYRERVFDPDGTVVHEDEGPLDEHFGHGSARDLDPSDP